MRRVVVPERLASLTGRNVHALAGALPELRDPQPDWADTDARRPPSNPLVTYKPGRARGQLPDRRRGREQRHGKSSL
ncbi:hypothetical protein [Streptomyces sp. CC219B]|uniref:hypothetical protein n=1 Tax=Streptomyces sp. CC219B TaxID=3044574 RepID=UPI0024A96D79|nr:hypothetical protein [Streptomyces sp. CC219B]